MTKLEKTLFKDLPQSEKFSAPLQPGDGPKKTIGCRHTNPGICKKHSMTAVCAFVRKDGMCLAPPSSWPKQYENLKEQRADNNNL